MAVRTEIPALFTTISNPPKCDATSLTTRSMSARLAMSKVQAFAIWPLAAISAATACAPSAARSVTATLAPSAANTRAVARPMPLAAPVTRTVNPFTDRLSSLNSDMLFPRGVPVVVMIDKAGIDPQTGQTSKIKREAAMANELDFSGKQVLVIGGSSGIGNGIAQAFRTRGAHVAVCGTRAHATEYSAEDGSDLSGLAYAQLDVGNPGAIEAFKPS